MLALAFWMVAWPAASILTGSPDSGWWGTQEAQALRQAARLPTLQGDFAEAERVYQLGADLAVKRHSPVARAWFLSGIAGSRFARFDYRGALDAYLQARVQAEHARDRLCLGAIDFNLSSLYRELGDFASALQSSEEGQRVVQGLAQVSYRPQLTLQLGRLRADSSSIPLYKQGIEAARSASGKDPAQIAVEAEGWDLLGEALLVGGDVFGAGQAEQKALVLRQQSATHDLGRSYWRLGDLRLREALTQESELREASLAEAERLTRQAMDLRVGQPRYQLECQLGRILLERGRVPEALSGMEGAIVQAQGWRSGIAPAFASLDGATAELRTKIFDRFVEAAASYGLQSHSQRWIEESFQAAELNRALNLQNNTPSIWRDTLPLEYRETLGKLQAEETKLHQSGARKTPSSESLKMRLTEMEAQGGLGSPVNKTENFPSSDSLILFRQRLSETEMLLSFSLGDKESFLWAVTRDTLHVYRLPREEQIRGAVREFRKAIEAGKTGVRGNTDVGEIGARLYTMLFGQLQVKEASMPAWLLSGEDALLELPFAALVIPDSGVPEDRGQGVFLAERHSLQVIAGQAFTETPLPKAPPSPSGFLSVGDPIYNFADPRWKSTVTAAGRIQMWWSSLAGDTATQFNRLPGSHREVEASAAAWGGGGTSHLLEGSRATREKFLESLSPAPKIIHLATHAFSMAPGGEAYLVFGMGANGRLGMLSTSAIQTLHVPGSVVVMTGCSTAPGDANSGLGLAGLVRAWTVAGASAVVATEWAVGDNAGNALLPSFYRHLQQTPNNVAESLRLAQVEMIHSGARPGALALPAAPMSWAAYQVFGNKSFGSSGMGSRSSAQ